MTAWRFDWQTRWDALFAGWPADPGEPARGGLRDHVFFSAPLLRAWLQAYQNFARLTPRFLRVVSPEGSEIFLPLIVRRHDFRQAGLRILHPVGVNEYDYHDPVVRGEAPVRWEHFWTAVQGELDRRWSREIDLVDWGRLRSQCLPARADRALREVAPFISTHGFSSGEEFLASLGKNPRKGLRRNLRRFEAELGPPELRFHEPADLAGALSALARMLEEHRRKWPASYRAPGFHEQLIREAMAAGMLRFSELRAGGEPMSWCLDLLHQGRFYSYLTVYREEYRPWSPGKVHLYLCLDWATRNRIHTFDLLRGDESMKQEWTSLAEDLHVLRWPGMRRARSLRLFLNGRIKPLLRGWMNNANDRGDVD